MSAEGTVKRKTPFIHQRVGDVEYITVGRHVVVMNAEDLHLVSGWTISVDARKYVRLLGPFKEKPQRCMCLSRRIMGVEKGLFVDHISGDTLDNRRVNLRVCTSAENSQNRKVLSRRPHSFKGVHYTATQRGTKKWAARIWVNGRNLFVGYYQTAKEAAQAYNTKALEVFGEFARLNVIESPGETLSANGEV